MGSIDIEKAKAVTLAQAQALAGQQSKHYAFDGSNIPGYDPATGIVSGGAIDDKTGKEYATGLRQGAESFAGLPGDIGPMIGAGAGKLAELLGADPKHRQTVQDIASYATPFPLASSTESIQQNITDPLFGKPDEPLTMKGDIARTAGQFAGGAFGPGGPVSKAAQMILPAVGSVAGGQLAKDTPYEPYARFAGAILGGGGAEMASRIGGGVKAALPTAAEIKQSAGYADLKAPMQAARINQETYSGIVKDLRTVANDFGMVPEKHGAFKTILLRHGQAAQKDGASLQDLETMRRSLQHVGKDPMNPSAGELSRQLVDKLDESVGKIGGSNVVAAEGAAGNETLAALKDARSTWQTGSKAALIEKAMEQAKNTASGFENGLRVEFRKLLNNERLSRQFSPTEKLALQQVVRGTTKSNMLRLLGGFGVPLDNARGFLGSVIGGGVGGSIGASVAGPFGAAIGGPLLMGIGTAAKAGANAATRNHATVAEALVKAGPKAAAIFDDALKANKAGSQQALLRALLQGEMAGSQVRQHSR